MLNIKNLIKAIKEMDTEGLMEIREDIQERVTIQAGFAMAESRNREFFHQSPFSDDCIRLALIDKELADRK